MLEIWNFTKEPCFLYYILLYHIAWSMGLNLLILVSPVTGAGLPFLLFV